MEKILFIVLLRMPCRILLLISGLVIFPGCNHTREPNRVEVIGKTEAEVVKIFGEPDSRETYDTEIPDPRRCTKAEIDEWWENKAQRTLFYGNTSIELNHLGKVVNVKKEKAKAVASQNPDATKNARGVSNPDAPKNESQK
jgi:hypothetical protein